MLGMSVAPGQWSLQVSVGQCGAVGRARCVGGVGIADSCSGSATYQLCDRKQIASTLGLNEQHIQLTCNIFPEDLPRVGHCQALGTERLCWNHKVFLESCALLG